MLLEKINSPQDLRKLAPEELIVLAAETRQRMLEVVSASGGHLASSLGVVELTIALHYCLDTPRDKLVWDVGHQTYAHKILTGRNKDFSSLRQYRGLSGFPSYEESPYDVFTTGHSSTAVSLALGLACARDCLPAQEHFRVAAVIGDGSLSGGLCFEGLNNAGHLKKDLLVVVNTNELSIAPNVGALSTYLNKLISLPIYNRFKDSLENFARSRIPKGSRLIKLAAKFEEGLKGLFVPGILFEELGFRYFGPLDGNNLNILIPRLKNILSIKGPVILHVITKKGKGYPPAESQPVKFHSCGPFEIESGRPKPGEEKPRSYTEVFGDKLISLARDNPRILAITAAMPEGTGLDKFRDLYPQRFFDVGIAESHALCFAAALAKEGARPIAAVYSTFLQRAYDQIIEAIALQKSPVILAIDRAGIVGEDGVTHQGIFDIAFLRSIPNLVVMAPGSESELENMLEFALGLNQPVAIRYPKAAAPLFDYSKSALEAGRAELLKEGPDFTLVALGSMVVPCWEARDLLAKEGLNGSLINARFVKPLDTRLFRAEAAAKKIIFSVEEGVLEGGFGSAIAEAIESPVVRMGLPSEFIPHGPRAGLLEEYGLTGRGISARIRSALKGRV